MGILDRIGTLARANINDLIDRAEDPEKVIKQLLADMNGQLIQVKTQVAASIADEKNLQRRWKENEQKALEWGRKAEIAVERDQDDLAREALQRRNTFQSTAAGFQEQYERQSTQVAQLKDGLTALESKITEANTKKDLLIARSRMAKTQAQIHTTLSGLDTSGSMASFDRMEEKVNLQEAKASALAELDTDTLDQRFALLEQESDVDRQLAALKAKKALPEAAPPEAKELTSGS